jgi:hypothetical protein
LRRVTLGLLAGGALAALPSTAGATTPAYCVPPSTAAAAAAQDANSAQAAIQAFVHPSALGAASSLAVTVVAPKGTTLTLENVTASVGGRFIPVGTILAVQQSSGCKSETIALSSTLKSALAGVKPGASATFTISTIVLSRGIGTAQRTATLTQ